MSLLTRTSTHPAVAGPDTARHHPSILGTALSAFAAALLVALTTACPAVALSAIPTPIDPTPSARPSLDIDVVVALRKTQAAQYYVDHALELAPVPRR